MKRARGLIGPLVREVCVTVALQYVRSGITANSILPGMMNAPMVHAPGVIAAYGGSAERWSAGATSSVRWRMGDAWDVRIRGAVRSRLRGQVHYWGRTGRRWRSDGQLSVRLPTAEHRGIRRRTAVAMAIFASARKVEPERPRPQRAASLGKTPIGILYGKVR
jgi:hypothetical protein